MIRVIWLCVLQGDGAAPDPSSTQPRNPDQPHSSANNTVSFFFYVPLISTCTNLDHACKGCVQLMVEKFKVDASGYCYVKRACKS